VTVPVGCALVGVGLLEPPDGELAVDPRGWSHPILIPLVGLVIVAPFTGIVLPPWPGLLDQGVAGVLAGMVLYRGSLYPVLLDDGRNSRSLSDPSQRRVRDVLPDGTLVGPTAFAVGLAWLAGAVTVSIVGFVSVEFVEPLEGIPLFPPSSVAIVGVPLLLGVGQVATYGLREVIVELLDHRRWLRRWATAIATRCRAVGSAALRVSEDIVSSLIRAVEYVVLLRP